MPHHFTLLLVLRHPCNHIPTSPFPPLSEKSRSFRVLGIQRGRTLPTFPGLPKERRVCGISRLQLEDLAGALTDALDAQNGNPRRFPYTWFHILLTFCSRILRHSEANSYVPLRSPSSYGDWAFRRSPKLVEGEKARVNQLLGRSSTLSRFGPHC